MESLSPEILKSPYLLININETQTKQFFFLQ